MEVGNDDAPFRVGGRYVNRNCGGAREAWVLAGASLTLWRGATPLFEALTFSVSPASALIIEGPNGAGKTTLLRVIAGLTQPETGAVSWRGKPLPDEVRAGRLRVAFSGHALALKGDLSTRENLTFSARLAGRGAPDVNPVLEATGLLACADLDVRLLSAGQKRRAALARVLLSQAELWLLDEPQTNLDRAGRELVEASIRTHVGNGGTVVVAAHQRLELADASTSRLQLGTG